MHIDLYDEGEGLRSRLSVNLLEDGSVSIFQERFDLSEPPTSREVALALEVMKAVERDIEVTCAVGALTASVKQECVNVTCPN